ncbi:MAG: UDP-2,3-diacylglucosamine diphosphatase [Comamonadaceae bacterium]
MNPSVPQVTTPDAAVPWPLLQAPPRWRNIDFISDLHLQDGATATFFAWQDFMQTTQADAVFILGDLFEVWVGDDTYQPEEAQAIETQCAQVLKSASHRLEIFFMHGNRDFLLGAEFARICGMTLIDDPAVLEFAGQRWLLSHGDALCLMDTDYMEFRTQVRGLKWQHEFLAQPLERRREIANALRAQSETRKRSGVVYSDVDNREACNWLRTSRASHLIHGHTHKPADHELGAGLRRVVLSDWDAAGTPPRMEVLRLTLNADSSHHRAGCTIRRITADLA